MVSSSRVVVVVFVLWIIYACPRDGLRHKVEDVKIALNRARDAGIQNILALRGDPSKGKLES